MQKLEYRMKSKQHRLPEKEARTRVESHLVCFQPSPKFAFFLPIPNS